MIMPYTVYCHTAPNGKRYVGVTSRPIHQRWRNGNGYRNNAAFFADIVRYGWDNIRHDIIATCDDYKSVLSIEHETIVDTKSNNPETGYNRGSYGCGNRAGWAHTEETKQKIGNAFVGRRLSGNAYQNVLQLAKEKRVRVRVQSLTGAVIGVYESVCDASNATGVDTSNIVATCKGKYSQFNGFMFTYESDEARAPAKTKNPPVVAYTLDGALLAEYSSATDAAAAIGCNREHIRRCCNFKQRTAHGLIFLYACESGRLAEKII